ncbi:MAG: hypothetical protein LQ349_001703, partial [Xanthoria aureola]
VQSSYLVALTTTLAALTAAAPSARTIEIYQDTTSPNSAKRPGLDGKCAAKNDYCHHPYTPCCGGLFCAADDPFSGAMCRAPFSPGLDINVHMGDAGPIDPAPVDSARVLEIDIHEDSFTPMSAKSRHHGLDANKCAVEGASCEEPYQPCCGGLYCADPEVDGDHSRCKALYDVRKDMPPSNKARAKQQQLGVNRRRFGRAGAK